MQAGTYACSGRRRTGLSSAEAESTLHCIEVLGCVLLSISAATHGEVALALWSLPALLMSAAALYLLHRHRKLYTASPVREWLCSGIRLHRAFACAGLRSMLRNSSLGAAPASGPVAGSCLYFAQAILVDSSILYIVVQALVLQLRLPLQALLQVAVAAITVRAMPAYCLTLAADGVPAAHFEWLARMQGGLSSVVMAATSASRGGAAPVDVPCSLSLSHLVVVLEVVLPLLVLYCCDAAPASWSLRRARRGSSSDGNTAPQAAPPALAPAATGGDGGGSSGSDGSSKRTEAVAAAAPTARQQQPQLQGQPQHSLQQRQAPRQQGSSARLSIRPPSACLAVLFGVALSGVLYDVVLTVHSRWPRTNW